MHRDEMHGGKTEMQIRLSVNGRIKAGL